MGDKIIGQKWLLSRLTDAVLRGRVNHSYIFEGPRGVGKKTLADFFAAAIHCTGAAAVPCGVCSSCVKHRGDNHPDYLKISAPEGGKAFGVDSARKAAEDMYIRPFLAKKKVYAFEDADSLTIPAQNALLKALEEPPGYTVIILLCVNLENLLPTVRSRAVCLHLRGNPAGEVLGYLSENYPDMGDEAGFISRYCGGIIGKAREIAANPDFMQFRAAVFGCISALTGKMSGALAGAQKLAAYANEHDTLFELVLTWFRDVIVLTLSDSRAQIINEDFRGELCAFAGKIGAGGAVNCFENWVSFGKMGKGYNYGLWLTDFFIKCWGEIHDTDSWSKV